MRFKQLIFLASFMLVACGGSGSDSDQSGEDGVVLVEVDGTPVTLTMLERVMEARGVDETDHERMRELLDEVIRTQAVANAARAEGLADQPQVRAELRLTEMQILFRHYLDRALSSQSLSEQDIRDVYDAQLARSGDTQYRIEVIGYEDRARVLQAIRRVQDGEVEFSALRAEAKAAGLTVDQTGWIDLSQVSEDFAAVLVEADTGSVVPQPLNNARGWFLVRLLEERDLQAPDFEQVRDGIARSLQQQRRQALVESLYDKAEITPMLPLEEAEPEAEN